MQWLNSHLIDIVFFTTLICSVGNAITEHYTQYSGVSKVFTFITEMLGFLTSKGVTNNGISLKLPLVNIPPENAK